MDQVSKIITLIGAVIGGTSAVGLILAINKIREGLNNDDSRTTNHGITGLIINGAMLAAVGGLVLYANTKLNGIKF